MGPLIRITTEPLQMVRFTQNARLVSSNSVDIERRKALARHISMHRSNPHTQGSVPVGDLTKINRAFSHSSANVAAQAQDLSFQQIANRSAQPSVPVVKQPVSTAASAPQTYSEPAVTASAAPAIQDVNVNPSTSYTAQRGAFEMRVARGDLTYLPPLVMTVITQRPQVHVEYLGGFNYVPPRDGYPGSNINLFT
ncbi:hypothetical protein D3Z51_14055 [Clostridiaceae bacterium]|nr:hypothetical protein [Lachnospiraceae bacterium]NBH73122.1 hypothetical protein [Clostridiaceae bacterium]RKI11633.1 hypothetical protein D7V81_13260 [bacterium 1XD21-70]